MAQTERLRLLNALAEYYGVDLYTLSDTEELPEIYEPGAEVEYFTSQEELIDKAGYYLEHDDERKAIALRGYERTKAEHTYDARVAEMIQAVNSTL